MVVQELLVVVERCLEGTEEVTNPNDVEYVVDDVHHSPDGVVHVCLVHDVLLSLGVKLLLDDYLDDLLGLDDDLQPPALDDYLELLGRQDVLYLLYDDISIDDVCIVDVKLVLLILDDLALLDDGASVVIHNVVLSLFRDVDVLDNGDCRCQSPSC